MTELKTTIQSLQQGLNDNKTHLTTEITKTRDIIKQVQTIGESRASRDEEAYASIRRLENILAGTKTRGIAGENILEQVLQQLPDEYKEYGLRIGGKSVEFAIPLPNGKFLPVDSKWTSVAKIEELASTENEQRETIIADIERDIDKKVAEVTKYLDPEKTIMMAIIAVPDAIYSICRRAHVDAHKKGVIIIGYSMAIPYILSVLKLVQRFASTIDTTQLSSSLKTIGDSLQEINNELEGRLSKTITQFENSRSNLKKQVGVAQQTMVSLHSITEEIPIIEEQNQLPL
jgi:DNA recombination protein RmuC